MPVYLYPATLVIDKKAVADKYNGGLDQFRKDHFVADTDRAQEDDELLAINGMDPEDFDIDDLVRKGLDFDEAKQSSNDFAIVTRYKNVYWKVNWVMDNSVFAWHINTHKKCEDRANVISNMPMQIIMDKMDEGVNFFDTIRLEDLE